MDESSQDKIHDAACRIPIFKHYVVLILALFVSNLVCQKGQAQSTNENRYPIAVKSIIPKEVFDIFGTDDTFVIGISDAAMDSASGYDLALTRAKMMASLTSNVSLSVVSESFEESADKSISKYEELFSIRLKEHVPFNVIASFRLSSGETIIIAKILDKLESKKSRPDKINSFNCEIRLYHIENITDRSQNIYRTSYRLCSDEEYEMYFVNGKWIEYCTRFRNNKLDRKTEKYFYSTEWVEKNKITDTHLGINVNDGLWAAYIYSYLWQLTAVLQEGEPSVKMISDNYSKKAINLNRTSEKYTISSRLENLILSSDMIYPVVSLKQLSIVKK